MSQPLLFEKAGPAQLESIIQLLQSAKLPTDDIATANPDFFIARSGDEVVSVIGLEKWGELAFLRSMVTKPAWRKQGLATILFEKLTFAAKSAGAKEIWLMTTDADKYFLKKGFEYVDRDHAPEPVKQTAQFTTLCSSTAIVMKKELVRTKKLLFVCVENSNRSQMSQAFARMLGGRTVKAYSAGSKPSGKINPKAIAAMAELGYDLEQHSSKSLDEVKQYAPFDAVVTMGCGDACPWMPAKKTIDWVIPDPREMNETDFRQVRDLIKSKVEALLKEL